MAKEADKRIQAKVLEIIESIDLEKLKRLFQDVLNYVPADSPFITDDWTQTALELIKESPRIIASAGRSKPPFQVIHIRMKTRERLLLLEERIVVSQLLKLAPFGLYAFSDATGSLWHLVNVRHDGRKDVGKRFIFRRISLGKDDRLLTASERLSLLELEDPKGSAVIGIQNLHDQAFNVEAVTDKFFKEYKGLFDKTKAALQELLTKDSKIKEEFEEKFGVPYAATGNTPAYEKWNHDVLGPFCQKTLSQIVFLYFIQRKGWLGVRKDDDWGTGARDFLRILFNGEYREYENFFNDVLEPLFYEALAKEHDFDFYTYLKCKVPFLNGGLFSPINDYDWTSTELLLPNELFSNTEYALDGYRGTGILDVFDRYNFTVKEDEPLEKEVAVDPEMLGKVFECLLESESRKKTGTYYTTREVVHYICRETLALYLENELELSRDDIDSMFDYDPSLEESLPKSIIENAELIDEALRDVRIIDPAVGSGAFPVGAMAEIVKLRGLLSPFITGKKRTPYDFKHHAIQENIYAVDIEPVSAEVAKLRMWLSLVVDEENPKKIKPLPNLEYKVVCGDSMQTGRLENQELLDELEKLEELHFAETSRRKKNEYRSRIDELVGEITEGSQDVEVYFTRVFRDSGKRGFDIVIGNPPWGLKADEAIKKQYRLGNRDSYGIFMAKAVRKLLKPEGILGLIVHDTWLTISTHRELRVEILEGSPKKVIRFHDDCFEGAAYTGKPGVLIWHKTQSNNNQILAADLTNISTKKEVVDLKDALDNLSRLVGISTSKFAVYEYPQELIRLNSNLPIFVGSPKLFALMNDTTCDKGWGQIGKKQVQIRQIEFNGKTVELVRFGDVAEVLHGLRTGDNDNYLFKNPSARGSYRSIEDFEDFLLTTTDLEKIRRSEGVRTKVIDNGIHKSRKEPNFDEDCWFGGRYIVPYDKGGESDSASGWLPNYYVPTNYYIDWSRWAVERMKTLTTAERMRLDGEPEAKIRPDWEKRIACSWCGSGSYFTHGITFSSRGVYSPLFRISAEGPFDKESACLFPTLNFEGLLGLLNSKVLKYLFKVNIEHTVSSDIDPMKEIPIVIEDNSRLRNLVTQITEKQKRDPRYDYGSNEQVEIDQLVYKMYGLNEDDIEEVEIWYERRYPNLTRSQKGEVDA